MEVMQVLHMKSGAGETSYANNSSLQRNVISMTRPVMEEAIASLYLEMSRRPSTLAIADLGCSSGPNTFFTMSVLVGAVDNVRRGLGHDKPPEYHVFMNDLPGNDFNALFRVLPKIQKEQGGGSRGPCFFTGVPGSFYERLFPTKSLHFVHSSYSLHWLSKVPEGQDCNKGNIYIGTTSPQTVIDAYYGQFRNDFSMFLKHRGHEVVPEGRMVLTILGRRTEDPSSRECCCIWELLALALNEMVTEGLIEVEKMDAFNVPVYHPSPSEVKAEVLKEGSFSINRLEVSEIHWTGKRNSNYMKTNNGQRTTKFNHREEGFIVARTLRAVTEPLLISHFGEGIVEDVFRRYMLHIEDRIAREKTEFINVTVSLTRRSSA